MKEACIFNSPSTTTQTSIRVEGGRGKKQSWFSLYNNVEYAISFGTQFWCTILVSVALLLFNLPWELFSYVHYYTCIENVSWFLTWFGFIDTYRWMQGEIKNFLTGRLAKVITLKFNNHFFLLALLVSIIFLD